MSGEASARAAESELAWGCSWVGVKLGEGSRSGVDLDRREVAGEDDEVSAEGAIPEQRRNICESHFQKVYRNSKTHIGGPPLHP